VSNVWFVWGLNRNERTVTLSRKFAGHPDLTVPWERARFCDGSAVETWERWECRPVELLGEALN